MKNEELEMLNTTLMQKLLNSCVSSLLHYLYREKKLWIFFESWVVKQQNCITPKKIIKWKCWDLHLAVAELE